MKNIKYIGHIKKGNRYIITVEKSEWFGWIKTRSQYIDSSSFYTHNKNKTAS